MPIYTESLENVRWGREGDAAHFMCTSLNCGNTESVADYENGQRPQSFTLIPGVKIFHVKCHRCGKGGDFKVPTLHQ